LYVFFCCCYCCALRAVGALGAREAEHQRAAASLGAELSTARADLRRHGEYESLRARLAARPGRRETAALIDAGAAEARELEAEARALAAEVAARRRRCALLLHCAADLAAEG
jgi:hypothetical protein